MLGFGVVSHSCVSSTLASPSIIVVVLLALGRPKGSLVGVARARASSFLPIGLEVKPETRTRSFVFHVLRSFRTSETKKQILQV